MNAGRSLCHVGLSGLHEGLGRETLRRLGYHTGGEFDAVKVMDDPHDTRLKGYASIKRDMTLGLA